MKHMLSRTLAVVMIAILFLTGTTVASAGTDAFSAPESTFSTTKSGGYIEMEPVKALSLGEAADGEKDMSYLYRTTATATSAPAKFVPAAMGTKNYPALRNQGAYGTCWAFATNALAELSILNNDNRLLDLSELHTVYSTYFSENDPLGGTNSDSTVFASYSENFLQHGGNFLLAAAAAMNWRGFAAESKYPYSKAAATLNSGISAGYAFDDTAHVRNALEVEKHYSYRIKELIQKYGAAGISYYDNPYYYNASRNSYYCPYSYGGNHSVAVVGWDDNFYVAEAGTRGAWLVRNSWGGKSTYNHDSYFWLSYNDRSISDSFFFLDCVSDKGSDKDEYYDNNYQYDGALADTIFGFSNTTSMTIANVFTAKKTAEVLKAVALKTTAHNMNYKLYIYKNLTNAGNPESGTLMLSQSGVIDIRGYNTLKLNKNISLKKGDTYSVIFTLSNSNTGTVYAVAEASKSYNDWVDTTANASYGQSFVKNGSWYDLKKNYKYNNLRIKAYTDNVTTAAVTSSTTAKTVSWKAITNGNGKATLSWNKVSSAKYYYIYRMAANATKWTRVAIVGGPSKTTWEDMKVTNGTRYRYTIRIHDGRTVGALSPVRENYYVAPSSVTGAVCDAGRIKISWKAVTGATGYKVYRKCNGDTAWSRVATVSGGKTVNWYDYKVTNGGKYQYYVCALRGSYCSKRSALKTCYFIQKPYIAGIISYSDHSNRYVMLKWPANKIATGYQVRYNVGKTTKTLKFSGNNIYAYISRLAKGNYKFYIRSVLKKGSVNYYSAWSNPVSITIK